MIRAAAALASRPGPQRAGTRAACYAAATMSSYHAVVPVSWSRMTEVVVPGWVEALLGRRTLASFAEEFAPNDAEFVTAVRQDVDRKPPWPAGWQLSPRYLEDIGWTPGTPFVAADRLRASALHGELDRFGLAEVGTIAVCHAIRFSASVELAGADRFENYSLNSEYLDARHFRYYARLHDAPRCQVAGTKNRYHFLDDLFTATYRRERSVLDCAARPFVAPALRDLLEALFLSTRAFPGIQVLDRNATWPAHDDTRFQGLLAPAEVRRLVPYLDDIARLEAALDLDEQHELFPLFADRVRRAADQGLALVTLHNGL